MSKLSKRWKRAETDTAMAFRKIFPDALRNITETRDGGTGVDVTAGNFNIQVKNWSGKHAPVDSLSEIKHEKGKMRLLISRPARGKKPVAFNHPLVIQPLRQYLILLEMVAELCDVALDKDGDGAGVAKELVRYLGLDRS